ALGDVPAAQHGLDRDRVGELDAALGNAQKTVHDRPQIGHAPHHAIEVTPAVEIGRGVVDVDHDIAGPHHQTEDDVGGGIGVAARHIEALFLDTAGDDAGEDRAHD